MLLDRDLTWIDGLVLVVLTLVVAHISFSLVETPFWKGRFKTSAVSQPLGLGIACILACVLAAGTIFSVAKRPAALSIDAKNYPGPTALLAGVLVPRGVDPVPPLTWVEKDLPIVYQLGCHQNIEDSEALSCTLGDPTNKGGLHVVVAGDSHAAQWIPALQVLAQKNGWKLTTFTKSACPLTRALTYASCAEWREKVMDSIRAIHPDLVVTSQRRRGRTPKRDRLDVSVVDGLKDVWSDLVMQGIRVVAVRDTPILATDPRMPGHAPH